MSNFGCRQSRQFSSPFFCLSAIFTFVLATLLIGTPPAAAASPTPIPTAVLVPTTSTSQPLNRRLNEIAKFGYTESEFFVSGFANIYKYDSNFNVVVETPNAPYTTRILIRMPKNPARFSGNVVVELYNETADVDKDIEWTQVGAYFLRHGDIWVGLTNKPIAIQTLKQYYNPTRYAPLTMTDDGQAWDIISQVGALLKSSGPGNPLNGYKVRHVYATGESQSGQYLVLYINSFSSGATMADGSPVYDGFVPTERFGFGQAINSSGQALPACDPRLILKADVPIIDLQSQTEIGFAEPCVRRPDGDTPGNQFRLWEVPGASHITAIELDEDNSPRDLAGTGFPLTTLDCTHPTTDFPKQDIWRAAFADLYAWVDRGMPPPTAPRIDVNPGPPPKPVLDQFGNAEGGVRTSFLDVPIAAYFASDTSAGPPGPGLNLCSLIGYEVPFTDQQLDSLYRNHGDYVHQVAREAQRLVRERFILPSDAAEIIRDAAHANVP